MFHNFFTVRISVLRMTEKQYQRDIQKLRLLLASYLVFLLVSILYRMYPQRTSFKMLICNRISTACWINTIKIIFSFVQHAIRIGFISCRALTFRDENIWMHSAYCAGIFGCVMVFFFVYQLLSYIRRQYFACLFSSVALYFIELFGCNFSYLAGWMCGTWALARFLDLWLTT